MPFNDYVPFLKFVGTLLLPIMYIVGFASKGWVTSDDREWGLWEWCFTNISDNPKDENYDNTTHKCHAISPGDSPGYYEGVRAIATVSLVFHLAYFATFNEKEGLGKDKNPVWVALIAMLGAVTTLGVMADNYKEDNRWKNDDPSLGWCFWLVTACAILNLFMMFVVSKFDDMKKGTSSSAVAQSPPRPPPERRASSASTLSLDRNRKITIFRTTESGGASIHGAQSSAARTSGGAGASASAEPSSGSRGMWSDSRGEQSHVLPLPRYDFGSEPGREMPTVPPPSYEEVTRGGALSPPPAYTVTPFGAEKME